MDTDLKLGILNLQDAFLNASLQRNHMDSAPLEMRPEMFHLSDRARFERTWVMFLFVLQESWGAPMMSAVRDYFSNRVDLSALNQLLARGKSEGIFSKLFEARSYMCHRDKREFWNEGRAIFYGYGPFLDELHREFSNILRKDHESRNPDVREDNA